MLFCLSFSLVSLYCVTGCFSVPAPLTLLCLYRKINLRSFYQEAERKPLKRFCHLQKLQRCHAVGFTVDQWEGSIGGVCCENWEVRFACMKGGRVAAGPDIFRHCAWEQEWIKKDEYVRVRVSMCERCVCPNLFICCTGGAIATARRCSVVSR